MYEEVLHAIAGYASIIPLIVGLVAYNKAQVTIRLLVILCGFAFMTETTGIVLSLWKTSNHFLFHIYPIVELFLFALIYRIQFDNARIKKSILSIAVIFLFFSLFNIFYIQKLYDFNTYGRGLESFILVILGIFYLISGLKNTGGFKTGQTPMFWINVAVLLYFPLTMVFFSMNNYLYRNFSQEFNNFLWDIHALLSFTQYILFTVAIYTEWKRTKSPVLS